MQKGKATTSPPAMVLQGRPPQQNPRGPPNSQQRPEDFNPRQNQPYQIAGPLPQNLMMQAMPGQMQGPHAQGQPRLPNQTFYQRPMRIPRPPPPSNQQVYSSPPGAPVVQMIGHPGAQFLAPGQPAQFIPPHVDFQLPMGGPPHYRPPQAMQGQFPPVSGPSQPHGPFVYQQSPGYPIGQPSPPVYIVRAPATPLQGMQQFQPQFEPRTRERKIIQIKDPNSHKDVTHEILKQRTASSLTSTAVGTPNNTPDLSGQSSSSSTPPLTSQQQAEANVRAQFAAQVAATLANNSEDRPKKPEYTIQKSTVNNRGDVDIVKAKETLEVQKEEALKGARKNDTVSNVVEKVQETQMKEGTVPVKSQPKETVKASKLCEGSSGESLLGSKSLVSSVAATTVANGKISNVSCTVEIFTKEDLYKESQKSNAPFVSDVVKTDEKVQPSDECDKDEKVKPSDECNKDEKVKPSDECDKDEKVQLLDECEKDEKVKRLDEGEKEVATDALPVSASNILNGPMEESQEQAKEDTEEVITIDSQPEVEAAVPGTASETLEPNEVSEDNGKELTQPEETLAQTEESEVLLPSSEPQEGSGNEKVNGHEVDLKKSAVANTPVDSHASVPLKDMKKKKQKHRLREMEKRSSEKETDMMEAYTEKPVQQETPDEGEEQPAEETTELQQEVQVTEDAQSDDETWETKEEMEEVSDQQPDGEKLTYMYDRDFLLQFQTNPVCLQKPDGLPDLEVVLVQARAPSKPGFQQNRMPKVDGGENTFLPAYLRQGSKNDRNMRGNRGRNVQAKKVIDFPSVQQQPDLKRVDNRWVRPSEASKSGNEEETKTEELYRKVRSILNKLTPQKFQTLTQQISELEIDTPERLEGAIDLIFEKAIDEANFSVAYANMCKCLLNKKVVVEKEGVKKDVSFRKILLNKCQKEFEREKSVEKTIHEKLEDLTKQGLSEEELQSRKRDLQDEERQQKRRTLGNIRFIGELFKLKMLTESIMHDCVVKLLKSNDEESFECLCKLLVTIGKDLDHEKAKPRVDQYFTQINKIILARKTSSRVRFMMQDIVDLRSNGWVPRREDNNPKTIDQIHREAADQAKKTQMAIQIARQDRRLQQRGNTGGRDSPRPGAIPQADESWTTVGRGPRNVSVDPRKFQNIKRPVDSKNISLGPGGLGYGAWASGSSGGSGAVGAGAGPSAAAAAGSSIAGVSAESDNRPANRYSAVEAVRAAMQRKRASQDRGSGRESPRTTEEVAQATDSGAGSAALAASQEVTQELMKKKSLSIIDEFLNIRDMREVAECLKELQSPSQHHVFVEVTFNHTMEKRASERQATGKLIHFLMRDGVLTAQHYLNGLESIFEVAEDTEIDIPQLWKYLGELIGPTAFDGNLGLDELFKCVFEYVSKHKAARLFACILQSSEKSPQEVRAFLDTCNVTVYTFFDDADEAREFAKDKNIEYALGPSPPSSHITGSTSAHSANVEEQLRTVILKRKARNEEVMDWIDDERIGSGTGEWKGGQFFVCSKDFRGEIALQEPQEKEFHQENLERQLVVLQQQLREKEQCLANYRAQLEERNLTETNLIQQLQQQEHQQENSQRQLQEMEEQIREHKDDKANLEKQLEVLQQQLSENQQCLTIYRAQLEERNLRETNLIQQLQEKELQGENSQRLLQEMEEQIRENKDDKANSERQLREMVQSFEERIRGKEEQKTNLETQLGMKNQQLREIETSLSAAQQMIIELRRQESCDWAISRDEIQVKDKYLGKGAWGSVNEATYCGCIVAVKQIHELILSPHNRRLFEREMNIASRCRHPCLLQFIGATNDEGSPLFVTELMELSLRALLEKRQLTETEISVISLDVSRALNYLHHMKPSPIVHRDVSSANVLLWRQGEQWRGKVSDYGTAKFVQQTMTVAPGALIYSAPEAVSSNQTSKVDVYSFGVLLCEMCIREMPDPERREEQVLVVKNRNFRNLVRQCLQADPAMRPDMAQIIQELEQV